MDIRFLGHAAFALEHDGNDRAHRPVPDRQPEGRGQADEVAADAILLTHGHGDHYRRHRRHRQAHRRAGRGDHRARRRDRPGGRRRLRPEPRRHRRVRLGLGAPLARLAHLDDAEGHGQHAGGASSSSSATSDLPPGRHGAVHRPRAAAAPRPHRRRADVHRRPLHDGPLRRGRRRGARRGRPGHPVPLRHVPADRDRRAGVQVRRADAGDAEVVVLEPGRDHTP